MAERRSMTAWLPKYSVAQRFLRIIEGTSYGQLKAMISTVLEQTGTPQSTVNWSDPGQWIPERLSGEYQALALRLWEESEYTVNPRHGLGLISICAIHNLMNYPNDQIVLTDAGKNFLENEEQQLARMDAYDGIMVVLSEVAAKSPAKSKDIFGAFSHFCRTYTTWQADGSAKSALGHRLNNLLDRDLIEKSGHSYRITIFGLDYLERVGGLAVDDTRMATGSNRPQQVAINDEPNSIFQLAAERSAIAREELKAYLQVMDPYQFEHLVKLLLEEMGYDDVEVTGGSGDKGVDVVANIELGISRVREVVQVKRQQVNIRRPVLDQLRGSLHYFNAVRGTIITTSGFTKGTKDAAFLPGAPPITLIDGQRLLDLLIEHRIGINRRQIDVLEFDRESLSQFEPESDEALSVDSQSSE